MIRVSEPFRIIEGPDGRRPDAGFDEAFWADRRFRVGSRGDRMGLRLDGDPVAFASESQRLSGTSCPR